MNMKDKSIILYTLIRKEVVRVLRIWPQSLLPSAITMTLYFLIFGKIIGSKIGTMDGIDYIDFITPGLIIMAVLNNSYSNVVSSFFGARFNKSIEELLVSPVSNHMIIFGFVGGGLIRSFIVGMLVSFVAICFGSFRVDYVLLFFLTLIFCGSLFSLGALINGIFSQKFDDTTIFPTFILTPLIYLGGVFYSLNILPNGWHIAALCNPLFYIVDLFRFACLGHSFISPYISFSVVIIFCVSLYFIVFYLLEKGIRLKQ